jgi:hypothetical protein
VAAFLFTANDSCDVYRGANAPPAPPDVAGVKVYVVPRFRNIRGDFMGLWKYTHVFYLPLAADVRDNDSLYLPDKNGAQFTVSFVGRARTGKANADFRVAYVIFQNPSGASNEG